MSGKISAPSFLPSTPESDLSNYYFVGAALPDVKIGEPVELTYSEFAVLLSANLTADDMRKVTIFRRFYDIKNMRHLWCDEEIEPYGNYGRLELEEAMLTGIGLRDYIYSFLEEYDETAKRLHNFSRLTSDYYRIESERTEGFLNEYLQFEREWRLVMTGMRAKKLERDLYVELQFEDTNDPIVAQLIAQKDAKTYEPPRKYASLKPLFEMHQDHPMDLHQAVCEYRFNTVDDMLGVQIFSIDKIIGYMVQLILAEKWLELDKQKGLEKLNEIHKTEGK